MGRPWHQPTSLGRRRSSTCERCQRQGRTVSFWIPKGRRGGAPRSRSIMFRKMFTSSYHVKECNSEEGNRSHNVFEHILVRIMRISPMNRLMIAGVLGVVSVMYMPFLSHAEDSEDTTHGRVAQVVERTGAS